MVHANSNCECHNLKLNSFYLKARMSLFDDILLFS